MTDGFNNVVCGVLVRSERVLLVHRNATRVWAPNCWDAPGGHVESGESEQEALIRELHEELGISVASTGVHLMGRLSGDDFDLGIFEVTTWSGEPMNHALEEHDDIGWFVEGELAGLLLADNDLLSSLILAIRNNRSVASDDVR